MKDIILFNLENDITDETVLAVLAALQSFRSSAIAMNKGFNSVHKTSNTLEMDIYIVCPNEEYHFLFEKCLSDLRDIYTELASSELKLQDFTYTCSISIEAARALGSFKPLAVSLGIIVGTEADTLPDVSNLLTEFTEEFEVAIKEDEENVFMPFLSSLTPEAILHIPNGLSLSRRVELVFSSKSILGQSSFETYLACALRKPVLEIQKDSKLYKWSNKNYICITDYSDENAIERGVKQCLHLISA